MNKIFKKLNIILFLAVIFSLFIINLLFYNKDVISIKENRELAKFPALSYDSYKDGSFFKGMENFYSDRFVFRDNFMSVSTKLLSLKGYSSDGIEIINTGGSLTDNVEKPSNENNNSNGSTEIADNNQDSDGDSQVAGNNQNSNGDSQVSDNIQDSNDNTEVAADNKNPINTNDKDNNGTVSEPPKESEDAPVVNVGQFVIVNNTGYETFIYNEKLMDLHIDVMNYYAQAIPEDVKMYTILAPTSIEFNLPAKYSSITDSQKDAIAYVDKNLDERIENIDVYTNMEIHKDEYLFFKTDHHWTALGAYRAYEAFMNSKGEKPISLDDYEKVNSETGFLGSIYNMTSNKKLESNSDDIWFYDIDVPVTYEVHYKDGTTGAVNYVLYPGYFDGDRKYGVFMGGDVPYAKIITDKADKGKIIVIKDSYANPFIPFLLPHYSEIHVVDPRSCPYNLLTLISDNEINEVLFLDYTMILKMSDFAGMIKALAFK